mgnify:CR=1 FL=1
MHMIRLPYAEDIRHPEIDAWPAGTPPAKADDAQIAAAEALLSALSLEEAPGAWTSSSIANPTVQRHYSVLQAIALKRDVPPIEEFEDGTIPDPELLESEAAREALRVRDCVCVCVCTLEMHGCMLAVCGEVQPAMGVQEEGE